MKPKIAFIANCPASLLNFRSNLMQIFVEQGYAVFAITPFNPNFSARFAEMNIQHISVPISRNGTNPLDDLALLLKLKKILREKKPDLMCAITIKPIIYGSIAARLAGVSKIYSMVTGTGYVFLGDSLKNRLIGIVARALLRIALYFNQRIFFQNQDNLNCFKEKKIISDKKSASIVNGSGIDCQLFKPAPYPQDISFLMLSRLLYDKGLREYIEAARRIKKQYPLVKFKLAGWIDINPTAISQNELDNWIQEGIIEFLGKLTDVRPAIAASSVYVLPSYHEGTPRAALEAMAMARPIITTNAPGCKETVIPHKNGFLVSIKNVQELCNAMEHFILFPDAIEKMGQESRHLAVEKYDVHKVNKDILQGMDLLNT